MMQSNRRRVRRVQPVLVAGAMVAVVAFGWPAAAPDAVGTAAATPEDPARSAIADVVRSAMATDNLRAVIAKVTEGDRILISEAFGTSMDGVPATTDMHFRNGSVAFAYLGTLLMQFVDEGQVELDDTIDRWMPALPEAD
jgi:CubicO group peptidase (beta-lactamase class C family)